jgi:hypothetical protein
MNDEIIVKSLEQMLSALVKVMARCDACEVALRVVAQRDGIGAEKMAKLIEHLTELSIQKRLEQTETLDPGLAARIDWRTEFPDLLD